MKHSDLERVHNGLVTGGSTDSPNGHNLVGAVNAVGRLAEKMKTYNLSVSDLTEEEQTELAEAQEDLQWHLAEVGSLMGDFTGNDGAVEFDDGTSVDLPKAASSASNTANLPASNN